MYFVHFFLNKNVYASKGVDLRSVCSHVTLESGKMPVKILQWWRNCETSGALCLLLFLTSLMSSVHKPSMFPTFTGTFTELEHRLQQNADF